MVDQAPQTTASADPIIQKVEQTHVTYEFYLRDRDFAQLIAAETSGEIPHRDWVSLSLEGNAAAGVKGIPGVCSVDYDEKLEPTISCMIETDYDNKITRDAIAKVIGDRVKRARRLATADEQAS